MKLKYIIPSFIAVIAMLVGCSDDYEVKRLDAVTVSESVIPVPAGDENDADDKEFQYEITMNAEGNWEITNIPEWLAVLPAKGGIGEQKVVFKAKKTKASRSVILKLTCNGQTQDLTVFQTAKATKAVQYTVAEALALIRSGQAPTNEVEVKGIVCKVDEISPQYGNATYYLSDDGSFTEEGSLQVYRGYWLNGEKFSAGDEFSVGDELVVKGTLIYYKDTTPEFSAGSAVVTVTKSLIKFVSMSTEIVSKEGGELKVELENKGAGVKINIPGDAKDWIHVSGIEISGISTVVTFLVQPNEAGERKAAITFVTTSDGKDYSTEATIKQAANVLPHGENPEDPFTVAEAVAKCKAIGNTTDGVIYFAKGVISSISSVDTGSYGNATFNISDDGNDENFVTVFRAYFLDNQKFTAEGQIGVGDEVVITGKLVYYKDKAGKETPEFSGNVYVYSIKKASNDPGTKNNPFTPEQAIAYIDGGGTDAVYVKGIVSELYKGGFTTQYGQGSFWISSDGKKTGDYLKDFEAYQVNYLGGRKWTEADPQIKVGDVVVIYGPVTKYKDTRETQGKGAAYIYSLNGKTE